MATEEDVAPSSALSTGTGMVFVIVLLDKKDSEYDGS